MRNSISMTPRRTQRSRHQTKGIGELFTPKKALITKGRIMGVSILANIVFVVIALVLINANTLMAEQLDTAKLDTLIVQNQKEKLEEDITYLNEMLTTTKNELAITLSGKNEQINMLYDNIMNLTVTNEYLKQDLKSSDEVQAFLLFEQYPYSGIQAEDLLYLQGQIQLYDNLAERDDIIDIVLGIYYVESRFDPLAASTKSTARGWGQFLRSTAKWIWEDRMGNGTGSYNHDMAFDKQVNMALTCNYLSYLLETYNGDVSRALIAYNGSELGKEYPRKVQEYVMANAGINIFGGM